MKIIKSLKGNSGCTLNVFNTPDGSFVRKQSSSTTYNSRLQHQKQKQKDFYSKFIKAPKIYKEGFNNDLYYFDMEYIPGIKFSDYINENNIQKTYPYMDIILDFIKSNNTIKHMGIDSIIKNKIEEIKNKTTDDIIGCDGFDIKKVPLSYCHGDLTLENIIINNKGDLYLIDFLDSFINTNLIDYSKILQDLVFLWSWRNEVNKPYTKILLLQEHINKKLSKEEYNMSYQLMKLNLLRILPYTEKNSKTYNNIINFTKI